MIYFDLISYNTQVQIKVQNNYTRKYSNPKTANQQVLI